MNRGDLARLAAQQVATAFVIAGATLVLVPRPTAALAGEAAALAAMLIGFGPLRIFLRGGPDGIVAGWIAAMIVRMAAALVGVIVLIRRFGLEPGPVVFGVCGAYLALLIVEAIGLAKRIGRAFDDRQVPADRQVIDKRQATASGTASVSGELGER